MAYQNHFTWMPVDDDEMMECIAEGMSFIETGRKMGISHNRVAGRFRRLRQAMGPQAS